MIVLLLVIGAVVGAAVGWRCGRASVLSRARADLRRELNLAWADMGREVRHWQDAAERATSEAAKIARETQAYKAGYRDGREDIIAMTPRPVTAYPRMADGAGAGPRELRPVVDDSEAV